MVHSIAHRCHGRILASRGRRAEATAAFAAAEEAAQSRGLCLQEALAVRDLTEFVLGKTG
eukprot:COSAG01_NODE_62170_length_286_cov_0.481283_1_plen_59_part_01